MTESWGDRSTLSRAIRRLAFDGAMGRPSRCSEGTFIAPAKGIQVPDAIGELLLQAVLVSHGHECPYLIDQTPRSISDIQVNAAARERAVVFNFNGKEIKPICRADMPEDKFLRRSRETRRPHKNERAPTYFDRSNLAHRASVSVSRSCPSPSRLSNEQDTAVIVFGGASEQAPDPQEEARVVRGGADGRTHDRCNGVVVLVSLTARIIAVSGSRMARKDVERRRDRLEQECPDTSGRMRQQPSAVASAC